MPRLRKSSHNFQIGDRIATNNNVHKRYAYSSRFRARQKGTVVAVEGSRKQLIRINFDQKPWRTWYMIRKAEHAGFPDSFAIDYHFIEHHDETAEGIRYRASLAWKQNMHPA